MSVSTVDGLPRMPASYCCRPSSSSSRSPNGWPLGLEDPRDPERMRHELAEMIRYRALLITAGYPRACPGEGRGQRLRRAALRSRFQDGGRAAAAAVFSGGARSVRPLQAARQPDPAGTPSRNSSTRLTKVTGRPLPAFKPTPLAMAVDGVAEPAIRFEDAVGAAARLPAGPTRPHEATPSGTPKSESPAKAALDLIREHVRMIQQFAEPFRGKGKIVIACFGEAPDQLDPKTGKPGRRLRSHVARVNVGDLDHTAAVDWEGHRAPALQRLHAARGLFAP